MGRHLPPPPSKGAAEPGRWHTARVPFVREIMDCLSTDHPARRVVFMKSTQVAGTEVGNNWVGSVIHREKIPMMVVQPTIDLAERWSKQRLAAMIDDTPELRALIAPARSRDSGNTTLLKEWPGGVLVISGANSGASLRSMPAKYLFADEVDAYPTDLDGEGDPLGLAEARTSTFADRKVFLCSTPTIASLSVIAREYEASDQRRYHVPCPHCGHAQTLEWDHLHWPDGRPLEAVYVCVECGAEIQEHHKAGMLAQGAWIAGHPDRVIAGFHINALYTPIGLGLSWGELAEEYERIKGQPIALKRFTNTKLGLVTDDPEEKIDWEELKQRAEPYPLRRVLPGCLVLTAGIDVQGDRWAILILGHGRDGEQWILDFVELPGDPTRPEDWRVVEDYLNEPMQNAHGVSLRITSTCIDSGFLQDDVIHFTRFREGRGIHAIKGSSMRDRPIIGRASKVDINWRGTTIKAGARQWQIGEDTAKARLWHILKTDRTAAPPSRRLHFSDQLDDSFYSQLTAEVYDPNKRRWAKIRPRNEALDCYGYALAAAMHPRVRLHLWTDAQWQRQQDLIEPATQDLFSAASEPESALHHLQPSHASPPPANQPTSPKLPPLQVFSPDGL
ncbi:MAG: phage terminase large subunit family protein [Chromatiales bacterium]|nr:phage terminase large subunit family protein [Chromatiales bacterium]